MFEVPDAEPIGLSIMVVISKEFLQFVESNAIQQSFEKQRFQITFLRYMWMIHIRDSNLIMKPTTFLKY